eukprot:5638417-Pleurochrysis_carterae.AAC.1
MKRRSPSQTISCWIILPLCIFFTLFSDSPSPIPLCPLRSRALVRNPAAEYAAAPASHVVARTGGRQLQGTKRDCPQEHAAR